MRTILLTLCLVVCSNAVFAGEVQNPSSNPDLSRPNLCRLPTQGPDFPRVVSPAVVAKAAVHDAPIGSPLEEIRRAADLFNLDFVFLKTVAKIESDFNPNNHTGQYIGLFQLSKGEFRRYGAGEITNSRDNAIAAACKFVSDAAYFEIMVHKEPTADELYLIHQQGWQGAAAHVSEPERPAWMSMCTTEEGQDKGAAWCKRAIWGNTLPVVKAEVKNVDHLTSGRFVEMWRDRIEYFYAQFISNDDK